MRNHSSWIVRFKENPSARMRLFCFPFAGGAASAFNRWHERLPQQIEICALQYPGRETRWRETPVQDAGVLTEGIVEGIKDLLAEKPFAFFGHSLGAMASFEVARLLAAAHLPEPAHLFLSGRRAPPFAPYPPGMTGLPDDVFKNKLNELNGTPAAVLENEELMSLLLPMLRADFTLDETYRYQNAAPLWQDFSIYGGTEDFRVPLEQLKAWGEYTSGQSTLELFPGDHFYIHNPESELYPAIGRVLNGLMDRRSV